MEKISFWGERMLLALYFVQVFLNMPAKFFLPLAIINFQLSYVFEKARPYTPLIIFLMIFDAIRMNLFTDSIALKIFEQGIILVIIGCIVFVRIYNIQEKFGLYQKYVKEPRYDVGFKYSKVQGVPLSVTYPCSQKNGIKSKWLPHNEYHKEVYQTMYFDPNRKRLLPLWFLKFIISYMHIFEMNVNTNANIEGKENYKVIIYSHGLGGHNNTNSAIVNWWASRGYIIIAPRHEADLFGIKTNHIKDQVQKFKYIYEKRNANLTIRKENIITIFNKLQSGYLDQIFGRKIEISEIILGGHSYGGCTILEAGCQLLNHKLYGKVKNFLCLDPWLFPLSQKSYTNLERDILFINSDTFIGNSPQAYQLNQKNNRLKEMNPKMAKLKIRTMDHLHQSDIIFVMGTILKFAKLVKSFKKSSFYLELNILIIYLFEKGTPIEQIINILNSEVKNVLKDDPEYILLDQRKCWKD